MTLSSEFVTDNTLTKYIIPTM